MICPRCVTGTHSTAPGTGCMLKDCVCVCKEIVKMTKEERKVLMLRALALTILRQRSALPGSPASSNGDCAPARNLSPNDSCRGCILC